MEQILLVEDSRSFASFVKKKIEAELDFKVVWKPTYAEAVDLIDNQKAEFFMAVLDLRLPDKPEGEIVDFVISKGIPAVVFTGDCSDDVREIMWSRKVVDYILKHGPQNIDYLIALIRRIHKNPSIKVLVVDDSRTARRHLCELLSIHRYNVLDAQDGLEAIEILKKNPDLKMLITDHLMPNMDGFQLAVEVRKKYRKEELVIIGISAYGNDISSALFLKNGANDFISKPFLIEEFYSRVTHNIETIEHIDAVQKAKQHGINLKLQIPGELKALQLEADERKLKQVMFNLLSNAAKFTQDGGSVRVSARIVDFDENISR